MDADLHPLPLVLMYHSVEPYDSDPFQVTVRPRRFAAQLRWLRRAGMRGVGVAELLAARRAGRGAGLVGLTFDDGYADFAVHVLPTLQRYGCTATVYVVAGAMGGHNSWDTPGPRKELMTPEQVRRIADAGVEIGAHALNHVRLPELDDAGLATQVQRSREVLVELTGQPVSGFCYPYGAVGEREVRAVELAGYDYACAVYPSALDGRHALPRTFVGDRDGAPRLYAKVARHRLVRARVA